MKSKASEKQTSKRAPTPISPYKREGRIVSFNAKVETKPRRESWRALIVFVIL